MRIALFLVGHGADVNAVTWQWETPMTIAKGRGHSGELVELLEVI